MICMVLKELHLERLERINFLHVLKGQFVVYPFGEVPLDMDVGKPWVQMGTVP